jgi:hypothetical protein
MHLWQTLRVPLVKTSQWVVSHHPRRAASWGQLVPSVSATKGPFVGLPDTRRS